MVQTVVTQVAIVALNMGSGIMTARLLGAEGRGVFTAVTVWPQLLAYASFLGLPAAFGYYLRVAPGERGSILRSALVLAMLLSTVAVLIGIVAAPPTVAGFPPGTVLLVQLCVLGTYPHYLSTMLRQALVGAGLFRLFNLASLVAPGLYVVAIAVVWASVGLTAANCAACLLLTILATDVWMARRVLRIMPIEARDAGAWTRKLGSYAGRASISDLLSGLTSNIDRLVLIAFIPPAELGRYAVAYSFSRLIQLPQVGVIMVLFPTMAGRPVAEAKTLHDHALRVTLYCLIALLLGGFAVGPWVLGALYGREFQGLVLLCDLLFAEAAVGCLAIVITQLYMSTGSPGFTSSAQAIGFCVLAAAMAMLVPRYGAAGAAAAMLVASSVRLAVLAAGIPVWLRLETPRLRPVKADLAFLRQRFGG